MSQNALRKSAGLRTLGVCNSVFRDTCDARCRTIYSCCRRRIRPCIRSRTSLVDLQLPLRFLYRQIYRHGRLQRLRERLLLSLVPLRRRLRIRLVRVGLYQLSLVLVKIGTSFR